MINSILNKKQVELASAGIKSYSEATIMSTYSRATSYASKVSTLPTRIDEQRAASSWSSFNTPQIMLSYIRW